MSCALANTAADNKNKIDKIFFSIVKFFCVIKFWFGFLLRRCLVDFDFRLAFVLCDLVVFSFCLSATCYAKKCPILKADPRPGTFQYWP